MKRFLLGAGFLILLALPSRAQVTSVSAQVLDPTGAIYSNCTVTANFVPAPNATQQPTIGGSVFTTVVPIFACDTFGRFTVALADNSMVSDGHQSGPASQWKFGICWSDKITCFSATIFISGSTQDITATLQAVSAILPIPKNIGIPSTTLAFTSNPTLNMAANAAYSITLTGNISGFTVTGPPQNGIIMGLTLCQDAIGGRTVTFPGNFVFPPSFTLDLTGSHCNYLAFKYDGTNWQPWDAFGGGGGGGATPPGVSGDIPSNNGPAFGVSGLNDNGTSLIVNRDTHFKGPTPWFDITRYGARIFALNPTLTTANCTATSTTVALASAIDFINGDGIVLSQCGPATSLTTPAAPSSVTPKAIVNGATTYSYRVFAEDYSLGLTAQSSATTITTGASSLGSITTLNISTLTLSAGIMTVVTTANHNLEVGAKVKIEGSGLVNSIDGVWYVSTTPNGTTFTVKTPFVDNFNINGFSTTTGTVKAAAHNWVRWTAQNNVLRWIICRQDGGAGNYNVVGFSPGIEPFFDDYNYGNLQLPIGVPSTCPSSAQNQSLATTIVSGAGTTSVVVGNAASSTISGVFAQHDNTVAYKAATAAAYNAQGGTVYTPPTGTANQFFVFNFPLVLPDNSNNALITHKLAGTWSAKETVIPGNNTAFEGYVGGNCGSPAFAKGVYSCLGLAAYPGFLVPGKSNVTFSGILFQGASAGYAQTVLVDGNSVGGGGSTTVNFKDSYIAANDGTHGAFGLVLRSVGFGHYITNTVFQCAGCTDFNRGYGLRITASNISSPTGWPGIGTVKNSTFLGNAVLTDADAVPGGAVTNGGSPWTFSDIFTESTCNPVYDFHNIATNNWFGWTFRNTYPADLTCPVGTPSLDFTNVSNLRFGHFENTGIYVNAWAGASGLFIGESINSYFDAVNGKGAVNFGSGQYNDGSTGVAVPAKQFMELPVMLRVKGTGTVIVEADPPTNVSAAVAAGGSVPINTWFYAVTAIDVNGGETGLTPAASRVTTTSGNQTVNLTWTAPANPPAGYNVYRSSTTTVGSGLRVNASPVSTTSYSDTSATDQGISGPFYPAAGQAGLSKSTGIWGNKIKLGNDSSFSSAPRSLPNVFLPGALTTTWTGTTWTPDKPVTITRLQAQLRTAPSGCGTNAIVRLSDGTSNVNLTLTASANDSGVISQNYAAGATLTVAVQTAASGCTAFPADGNVTISYRMQ